MPLQHEKLEYQDERGRGKREVSWYEPNWSNLVEGVRMVV
jgi:hypothetical protein